MGPSSQGAAYSERGCSPPRRQEHQGGCRQVPGRESEPGASGEVVAPCREQPRSPAPRASMGCYTARLTAAPLQARGHAAGCAASGPTGPKGPTEVALLTKPSACTGEPWSGGAQRLAGAPEPSRGQIQQLWTHPGRDTPSHAPRAPLPPSQSCLLPQHTRGSETDQKACRAGHPGSPESTAGLAGTTRGAVHMLLGPAQPLAGPPHNSRGQS